MNANPSLSIAAELQNLDIIRRFVEETAQAFGVETDAVLKVQLAVDEAATNIIIHGYQGQKGNIEIEMRRAGNDLMVSLRDKATPFDPTQVASPDLTLPLEQRAPGGLGIYLMRHAVDEMVHRSITGGGNELILIKRDVSRK
jgi:serine/threonine-protein kinase RsbW